MTSSLRRSTRSASEPAHTPPRKTGANVAAETSARSIAFPPSSRTSHATPTAWMKTPEVETIWLRNQARYEGTRRATTASPRSNRRADPRLRMPHRLFALPSGPGDYLP